ncbi:MAG TPA: asparagine synthase (glutamine-hydrolyzing) [Actinomycetota bacterium]|nr:asparagine synthase (glutamine-hydrolyzing) [Actinomycetota bacterium]
MCGLLGFAGDRKQGIELEQGLRSLAHRGPDESGSQSFQDGDRICLLAHTRLKIVDLSERAAQPMTNEDGTVWLIYNGELYNHRELRKELEAKGHRFVSDSDTEVVVHLYEDHRREPVAMLHELRGMFGFAIYDRTERRLFIARDRFGIKPMYTASLPNGGLGFASEVRALVKGGLAQGNPDPQAVSDFLCWGSVVRPHTIIEGVRELPPGHALIWAEGKSREVQWWRPRLGNASSQNGHPIATFKAALEDSVRRHLIADRPVGVFLSGGVDSGAVLATAARLGPVKTLTVSFPDEPNDESEQAAETALAAGAEHQLVPITGTEIRRDLNTMISAMDQPTSDGINSWIVSRAASQAGLVVALSGLGGDELFMGYPTFRRAPWLLTARAPLAALPGPMRRRLFSYAMSKSGSGKGPRLINPLDGVAGAYLASRGLMLAYTARADAYLKSILQSGHGSRAVKDRVTELELGHYMQNQLLRDTDQMSMSHSIEVRVPLLDDVVAQTALGFPAGVRGKGKTLIQMSSGLPHHRRKQPFALPFASWIRGPLKDVVKQAVLSTDAPFGHLVDGNLRRRIWEGFENGTVHWSRPWALTVLRMWPECNGFSWS